LFSWLASLLKPVAVDKEELQHTLRRAVM